MKINKKILSLFLAILMFFSLTGCDNAKSSFTDDKEQKTNTLKSDGDFDASKIPVYSGKDYVAVNDNIPFFDDSDNTTTPFEKYSPLDNLGRCGCAYANVCREIMPTTERGEIGQVKPTGWHTVKYEAVDGKYLYNRSHLIGYQLSGENANEKNLITGTRYFNACIMLPFENMVADYVKETNNHVLYRVTPVFDGDNLVAKGVLMEALSVEDKGDGICFNVFCYNIQPGITIDYKTGESTLDTVNKKSGLDSGQASYESYIGNRNTKKLHKESCSGVKDIKEENKVKFSNRNDAINDGYEPCKMCNP